MDRDKFRGSKPIPDYSFELIYAGNTLKFAQSDNFRGTWVGWLILQIYEHDLYFY